MNGEDVAMDADEPALDAGGGVADPMADERVQFYLRHRSVIREWAAIERDVLAATNEVLLGLRPRIESEIRGIDPLALVQSDDTEGKYPRLTVRMGSWPTRVDGSSIVGLSLEWARNTVDPIGGSLPYIGIKLDVDTDEGKRLRAVAGVIIDRRATELAAAGLRANPRGTYWPAITTIPKSENWWRDREPWEADIARRVRIAWPPSSAVIEEMLGASPR